jgi:hypothetical protein
VALDRGRPSVLKAALKLPSFENIADNYWREGNMLGSIELDTGRITRLVTGFGLNLRVLDPLPALAAQVGDLAVPQWDRVKRLALEATAAVGHLNLLGWDIALAEQGPVIVEANANPDLSLHQICEGRGMQTSEFSAFIEKCRTERARLVALSRTQTRQMIAKDISQIKARASLAALGSPARNMVRNRQYNKESEADSHRER